MKKLTTVLNAKELKATLKAEGIKVISCKKSTGSLKDCVNLVISSDDLENSMFIMNRLNICNNRGLRFEYKYHRTNYDYTQFPNCKGLKS